MSQNGGQKPHLRAPQRKAWQIVERRIKDQFRRLSAGGFGLKQSAASVVRTAAGVVMRPVVRYALGMRSLYRVECYDRHGALKWVEEVPNIVVDEGLDDLLDKYFKGSAYTAAHYVGLVDNANFTAYAAGDVAGQINGTNGWDELTAYTESNRPSLTLGSVASKSVDNSASKAQFSINATHTVRGAFVVTNNTKAGTTGTLYGAADFSSARSVENGDTVNVTVTLTAASA